MTDPRSRYASLATRTLVQSDGRMIAYRERRFLPAVEGVPAVAELTVEEGDRLDLLAHRAFGDSLADWRLADAAEVLWPDELEVVGTRVKVLLPQVGR